MYCILITGIPASGKSTAAEYLSKELLLPAISKDRIKELLFDCLGFKSREEKVKLGNAAMDIMYYMAEQLMKCHRPFILENNFEHASKDGLTCLLEKYDYTAITVTLTGDYRKIYERYAARNMDRDRHRGHVVNDCYPEAVPGRRIEPIPYESFLAGIKNRGMDAFIGNGPHIVVDTSDFANVDFTSLIKEIQRCQEELV